MPLSVSFALSLQVTYQMKIFTTAIFSITMLDKKITTDKWVALVMLAAGVATVQIGAQGGKSDAAVEGQSTVIGLTAVIAACCTSGFAGVYFEKILKGTKQSVWLR
jgi:UDP-sugar transporter A1/2/3